MVSLSVNPVGSWWLVAAFAAVVTGLTLWAYWRRIKTTRGAWRWFALGLRLAAVLLCAIAALRPSIVFQEKKKQPASLLFLVDDSTSMTITDEVSGQSRWETARKTLDAARETVKSLGDGLTAKYYRFDSALKDDPADAKATPPPEGRETALGQNLIEAQRRESGTRVAAIVVLSDGANNSGLAPLVAASQLRSQQIPVVTVGYGSENVGSQARDIAVRDLVAGPTVFVKNQLQVKGTLVVRGFAKETLAVEMFVDGEEKPVATQTVRVPADVETLPIAGLKYIPQTAGEKKVTLRVKPNPNERLQSNNEMSTYVTVQKGGLNVLFVQGPSAPWEPKFWLRSVGASPDIQADLKILRKPAAGETGELTNEDFAQNKYDVYVLSDLPANFLTDTQQALLARGVERGAGLVMLGGRSSFGPGGWARSPIARVLPTTMSRTDGQIEPKDGGVKFVPNTRGLDNFLFQIAGGRAESQRVWAGLPPLAGISMLGEPKRSAVVYAYADGDQGEPVMVGAEAGQGRTLAFGGETWHWTRDLEKATNEGILAHRKFWRQVIFWLAHKEDKGENEVKLTLNERRIASGQKLDFGVTAKDPKGDPIPDVKLQGKVESESPAAPKFSTPVEVFGNGEEAKGSFLARQTPPGEYRMSVVATRDGKEVGRDSARFLVYQDDRELENPAADLALLRQVAQQSGGESLPPEKLGDYLKSLKGKVFTESTSLTERKVWDNWPFFLLFATLLTLEWFLRKRHGWV